jgi:MFS superfamily sulfate permease-like transporter
MLAAIGIIIIAKQIHILLGVVPHSKTPLELLAEIPTSAFHTNPEIALIGALTLCAILFIPKLPKSVSNKLPPALVALVLVIPLALYWHLDESHQYEFMGRVFGVGPKFLVELPSNLLTSITFPDFSALQTLVGWKYVVMLALVGSVESLLTVAAIDSIDPKKRKSNLDADLTSVGVGNLIASMIGGLPMISEVVRSKANIDNGAESKWSNFFHALFLLIAVVFFANIIHEIPLSALAAMLILTGFRLSSPREFYRTFSIGLDQIVIFITTLLVTLMIDLLAGVFLGVVVKVLLHWYRGVPLLHLFKLPILVEEKADRIVLRLRGAVIFSNFLFLLGRIQKSLATDKLVIVDLSEVNLVDHTALSKLLQFADEKRIELLGLGTLKPVAKHSLSTHIASA